MVIKRQYAMSKKEKQLLMNIDTLRLKFLRLLRRMGNSKTHPDTLFEQVMHRLGLEDILVSLDRMRPLDQEKNFLENVIRKFQQVEDEESEDFGFTCNILILGKTGVGKSSTINSIFDGQEEIIKAYTNPFIPPTESIIEISGMVDGVHLRIFDTPGLKISLTDQGANIRMLKSVKKCIKGSPPDIVLYVDRIDTHALDFNDLPALRSITNVFGSSIWFKAIIALTHAASDSFDALNGSPMSYELFVAKRSHAIQQSIRHVTAYNGHMIPLALVENHPCCKRNEQGERVLPNDLSWRSQLLLQCCSSKILSEADSHFKLGRKLNPRRFGEFLSGHSSLSLLLSSFLGHLKPLTHNPGAISFGLYETDVDFHNNSIRELEEAPIMDLLLHYYIAGLLPVMLAARIAKEKKTFKIEKLVTTMGKSDKLFELNGSTNFVKFKMQSIGEKLACTFKSESKWTNSKKKSTTAGISVTIKEESIMSGFKLEDHVLLSNNSISLVGSTGIMTNALSRESAYGAKLEAHFKDKTHPMKTPVSTCGFLVCKRQGDLSLETNLQHQLSIGRNSKLALRFTSSNLNWGSVIITTTTSSSIIGLFPVLVRLLYFFYSKV